jgi:hypothetical protein
LNGASAINQKLKENYLSSLSDSYNTGYIINQLIGSTIVFTIGTIKGFSSLKQQIILKQSSQFLLRRLI